MFVVLFFFFLLTDVLVFYKTAAEGKTAVKWLKMCISISLVYRDYLDYMKIHEGHNDIYVILKLMSARIYSLYTLNNKQF